MLMLVTNNILLLLETILYADITFSQKKFSKLSCKQTAHISFF